MRLSTYHKSVGDAVTFTRGRNAELRSMHWHRVYVSSLFTWELPRTLATVRYYEPAVSKPTDIVVGGIGATLLPQYLQDRCASTLLLGQLDQPDMLDPGSPAVADLVPDYQVLETAAYPYYPQDAYFVRTTVGCVRKCQFCAVPRLEPTFGSARPVASQITEVADTYGDKQDLIVLDNNVLGISRFSDIVAEIRDLGFATGRKRMGRGRRVDFNQGIDARLVTPEKARQLASICVSPVRLAFDYDGIEKPYRHAVRHLADVGLRKFTNYLLYNFNDDPASLYRRLRINAELIEELGVAITGFPMRFIPMDDVTRRHVAPAWTWRYLRGMQCVLLATRGLVSPNRVFLEAAFGSSLQEFLEILAMPDRYIIWRNAYRHNGADNWRVLYRGLSDQGRIEFLDLLARLNASRTRPDDTAAAPRYRELIEHYYPDGKAAPNGPPEDDVRAQGLATDIDSGATYIAGHASPSTPLDDLSLTPAPPPPPPPSPAAPAAPDRSGARG
jgi:hypothetical protein